MRTTLHVLPLEMAPIVHQATLAQRIAESNRYLQRQNLGAQIRRQLEHQILEIVGSAPQRSKDIVNLTLPLIANHGTARDREKIDIIRNIIKLLWEQGTLCYVNNNSHWAHEDRHFDLTSRKYPLLELSSVSIGEAVRKLVALHIKAYGPVTIADIKWWSGLKKSEVDRAIQSLEGSIVEVEIEGLQGPFYHCKEDVDELLSTRDSSSWTTLLAHEDPALKAYFSSRERYVKPDYYSRLFNQIGEARASIIRNGVVIGTWAWQKKERRIVTDLFEPGNDETEDDLRMEITRMEDYLRCDYNTKM